jgi:TRAP-type C4-dicarboxylate transport system permease small subunit
LKIFGRFTDKLNKVVLLIASILFIFMSFCTVAQVFARFIIKNSLPWSEEYARYAFIYVVLLGITTGVKKQGHAFVELFIDRLKGKLKIVIQTVSDLVSTSFFAMLVVYGYKAAISASTQYSPATNTNMGIVYAALPISAFIMFIYSVEILINLLLKKQSTDDIRIIGREE